jgi:IS5 family transposase
MRRYPPKVGNLSLFKATSTDRVIVDTTVISEAVAPPTDSRLLEQSRHHLVKLAEDNGIALCKNYNREAPQIVMQVGRYTHAKQFRRMKKSLRTFKPTRVYRDIGHQMDRIAEARQDATKDLNAPGQSGAHTDHQRKKQASFPTCPRSQVHIQRQGKKPVWVWREGNSCHTTREEGIVLGMCSLPGNPYDGYTHAEATKQGGIHAERTTKAVILDRGTGAPNLKADKFCDQRRITALAEHRTR